MTGLGAASGVVMEMGAGVMGVNMELAGMVVWEGEVGRENAVKGLTGGSSGDTGGTPAPDTRLGSGREWLLPRVGWLDITPGKYPANDGGPVAWSVGGTADAACCTTVTVLTGCTASVNTAAGSTGADMLVASKVAVTASTVLLSLITPVVIC